ncbi:MAG: branched-chain amino acid ABC transporter ATP-binding protein/permease, partial [Deltaproteobacteria bacterium]|nr:branched-chain amino acid ABC transporter ATP-binding protein/permease [Deltaproteobacteria bacterium]
MKHYLGLIVLAGVIIVFPFSVSNPYYLNVANIIGLNSIVVAGLNLLIGYAGQISLGHAAFYGLGAYFSGILTVTYQVNPIPAMLLAMLATGLIALLIGIPTLKLHGHYLVMATVGFNLIVNIIILQWDSVTGGPSGFPGIPNLKIGALVFDTDQKMYYLIWGLSFLIIILSLNLVRSRVGRGLRALHGSEPAASSLGVQTARYKVKVFVISTMFASLAGSLYAYYLTFISPKTFDIFFSIELVTMVIAGGIGNVWGALLGTVFFTTLPSVLDVFDEYKDIFYGLILVAILIFLPQGVLVGIKEHFFSRKRSSDKDTQADDGGRVFSRGSSAAFCPQMGRISPDRTDGGVILSVRNVSINFGGIMALAQVSLDLFAGQVTALIGPNGAGKTTMINVVSGIHRPTEGSISFFGQEVKGKRSYYLAGLGLTRTFQNNQTFSNMTVLENVMVGLHAKTGKEFIASMFHLPGTGREEKAIEQRAWEVLRFFRLEDKGHWSASALSFGEQKRVEMARALAPNPRLILLDEPVAGLNMTETDEIARLICDIRDQGISVLLVE